MNRPEFNLYIRERQEGMCDILESSDVVMEFLKFKKKEKRSFKEENTIDVVNKEIKEIGNEFFGEIKRNIPQDIYRRLDLDVVGAISRIKKENKTEDHYYSGTEFSIIGMNVQSKHGEDPKQYKIALCEIEINLKRLLEEEYPRFKADIFNLHLPYAEIRLILK